MAETLLGVNDKAPDFSLTDQNGNTVTSKELLGKPTILFFYPAALTPGCTKEACDFRDSAASLAAAGYQIVGISKDAPEKLAKFAQKHALAYPLLSDPDLQLHKALGAYGEKKLYGKVTVGVIRSTFIVDSTWHLTHVLRNVKATGHVARLHKLLLGE